MIPTFRLKYVIREHVAAITTQCSHLFAKIDVDTTRPFGDGDSCYDMFPEAKQAILVVRLSEMAAKAHSSLSCDDELLRKAMDSPLHCLLIIGNHGCSTLHRFSPNRFGSRKFTATTMNGRTIASLYLETIVEEVFRDGMKEIRKSAAVSTNEGDSVDVVDDSHESDTFSDESTTK